MTEHVGFLEGVCFESGFEGGKKPERTEGKERKGISDFRKWH